MVVATTRALDRRDLAIAELQLVTRRQGDSLHAKSAESMHAIDTLIVVMRRNSDFLDDLRIGRCADIRRTIAEPLSAQTYRRLSCQAILGDAGLLQAEQRRP